MADLSLRCSSSAAACNGRSSKRTAQCCLTRSSTPWAARSSGSRTTTPASATGSATQSRCCTCFSETSSLLAAAPTTHASGEFALLQPKAQTATHISMLCICTHPFAASPFCLIGEVLSGLDATYADCSQAGDSAFLDKHSSQHSRLLKANLGHYTGHLHSRAGASLGAARAPLHPSSAGQGTLQEPPQAVMHPSMAVLLVTSDRYRPFRATSCDVG